MKINVQALSNQVIRIGGPIVLAAIAHKVATGKFDLKGAAIDAATQALGGGASIPPFDITKPASLTNEAALAVNVLSRFRIGGPFTTGDAGKVISLIGRLHTAVVPSAMSTSVGA